MLEPALRGAIKDWIHIILCIKAKSIFCEWDIRMFPHFGRDRVTPFYTKPTAGSIDVCPGDVALEPRTWMPSLRFLWIVCPLPQAIFRIAPRLFHYDIFPNICS
jgi:hypothetical protein